MAKGQISEDNTTMSFVIPKNLKEELVLLLQKKTDQWAIFYVLSLTIMCNLINNKKDWLLIII